MNFHTFLYIFEVFYKKRSPEAQKCPFGNKSVELFQGKTKSTTGYPLLREVIMRLIVRRIRRLVPVVHKPVGTEEQVRPFTITL